MGRQIRGNPGLSEVSTYPDKACGVGVEQLFSPAGAVDLFAAVWTSMKGGAAPPTHYHLERLPRRPRWIGPRLKD
jgi:hypothetical protein